MVVGGLLGVYVPSIPHALSKASFYGINAVVAVLLWLMIFPMLVQIDFRSLRSVKSNPGALALTTVINYCVKPFSMFALALLFMRVFYVHVIPDAALRDSYTAGLVLLAGAPCTAMVFVWSGLMGGDPSYTLVQVAINDAIMLALYVPICRGLIGASHISLPWGTIILAVTLFIIAPVIISSLVRWFVVSRWGEDFLLNRVLAPFKHVTVLALLATLVLIFTFQGKKISQHPLDILLLAVPIIIQSVGLWALSYSVGWAVCIPHSRNAPASLIATSNFFELAVAVAISVYGLDSGAALATVVGVLVEVPVMLTLCRVCVALGPKLTARCDACEDICPGPARLGKAVASACCKTLPTETLPITLPGAHSEDQACCDDDDKCGSPQVSSLGELEREPEAAKVVL